MAASAKGTVVWFVRFFVVERGSTEVPPPAGSLFQVFPEHLELTNPYHPSVCDPLRKPQGIPVRFPLQSGVILDVKDVRDEVEYLAHVSFPLRIKCLRGDNNLSTSDYFPQVELLLPFNILRDIRSRRQQVYQPKFGQASLY